MIMCICALGNLYCMIHKEQWYKLLLQKSMAYSSSVSFPSTSQSYISFIIKNSYVYVHDMPHISHIPAPASIVNQAPPPIVYQAPPPIVYQAPPPIVYQIPHTIVYQVPPPNM